MREDSEALGSSAPGCGMTPTLIVAVVLAFIWMIVAVPLYQRWRYPPPPPEAIETVGAAQGAPAAPQAIWFQLLSTAKRVAVSMISPAI